MNLTHQETDRVCPIRTCGERVFEIRNTTDFYFDHLRVSLARRLSGAANCYIFSKWLNNSGNFSLASCGAAALAFPVASLNAKGSGSVGTAFGVKPTTLGGGGKSASSSRGASSSSA